MFSDEDSGWLATLGLRVTANVAEVKSAYRRLAAKWHPDKWGNNRKQEQLKASARFTEIAAAYRALCDKASLGRM